MSTYRTKEIKKALLNKGFRQKNTDHEMFWLWVNDKKTSVRTRLSFGSKAKEYGDNLLGCMARQLKLPRAELDELIECPLSKEEYQKILIEGGAVKLSD